MLTNRNIETRTFNSCSRQTTESSRPFQVIKWWKYERWNTLENSTILCIIFQAIPESMEKKAYKIKDKDKDLQDNGHAMYTIWSRNLELQSKTNFQTKWNSTQTTQDHCGRNLARIHMLTFSILSNLVQIKILIGLCQMMKPKHLISSQLKRWLDCPDSDIQVMSWEWTTPGSPKFYSMEK